MFGVGDPTTEAAVRAYVKLMRASQMVVARIEPGLAREGLTVTQLGVLEALLHKGPLGQRALGRKLLSSPGNMSDVIAKLTRRGLVRREADPADRRQVRISLTPEGDTLIRRVFPAHAADIARAMAGLDAAETALLDGLLRKLGRAAERGLGAPGPPGAPRLEDAEQPPNSAGETFDVERLCEQE